MCEQEQEQDCTVRFSREWFRAADTIRESLRTARFSDFCNSHKKTDGIRIFRMERRFSRLCPFSVLKVDADQFRQLGQAHVDGVAAYFVGIPPALARHFVDLLQVAVEETETLELTPF